MKTLQKQIDAKVLECLSLQQYWLRQQNELVRMIKDVTNESSEIESLKKQSTILLQKKLRIEGGSFTFEFYFNYALNSCRMGTGVESAGLVAERFTPAPIPS